MPDLPNIKKEILEYVIQEYNGTAVNLRDFADENDYSRHRVGRKAAECGVFNWGTSPMGVWPNGHDISVVEDKLEEY